jgi:hypothetical protein
MFGRKRNPGPVLRHESPQRDLEPPAADGQQTLEAIDRHMTVFTGPPAGVIREIVSDVVQINIHVVPAAADRPFHALVTSGMSDRAMAIPKELQGQVPQFAELMILLPQEWEMDQGMWRHERHYWPIRQLKLLARAPHTYGTWLSAWHSSGNGDPPRPFASDTRFCGTMLAPPVLFPEEFATVHADDGREISLLAVIPLLPDELEAKVKYGVEALVKGFETHGINELFDPQRGSSLQP